MSELKPCPKCGPDGAPLRRIGEMDEYSVECVECYTVRTPWFKTPGEAEAYWNAFAEGMKLQDARIAELEKENRDQLIDYENRLCEARKYQQDAVRRCEEMEAECVRLRKALERVVKLLDRPMLKDDMCLYMDKAIRVAHKAQEEQEEYERQAEECAARMLRDGIDPAEVF